MESQANNYLKYSDMGVFCKCFYCIARGGLVFMSFKLTIRGLHVYFSDKNVNLQNSPVIACCCIY